MSEIEQVQEQMKAAMEAMMDQIMAMMDMRKIMEVNATATAAASITSERDPTHPSGLNQLNPPVSDVVGQGGETAEKSYGPHYVQVQSKSSFPLYSLPPNYTLPIVVYATGENIGNSAPVFIENKQPQPNHTHAYVFQPMGESHDAP